MKTALRAMLCAAALAATVSGCSDPKAANESNFAKVINEYLKENSRACVLMPMSSDLAGTGSPDQIVIENDNKFMSKEVKRMNTLETAGLFSSSIGEIGNPLSYTGKAMVTIFMPTPEGKKYYRQLKPRYGTARPALCFADTVVESITRFTEPGQMMGATFSSVDYTYSFKNVAAWTQSKPVQEAFPEIGKILDNPKKGAHEDLVLTNKGWDWKL